MINAIIAGISTALYREFGYENHMEEIKQGLSEPCFFISCVSPESRRYLGKLHRRTCQFVIQYFPKSENSWRAECNDTAERMQWCLETIYADGVPLCGTKMKYEIVEGTLHFFVNYDGFVYEITDEALMEDMEATQNAE